jgi:hypothetical protein
MTSPRTNFASNLVLGALVASLCQAAVTVIGGITAERLSWLGQFGWLFMLLNATIGFWFIARDLTVGQAVVGGLIYYPVAFACLTYLSLLLAGNLFGNWL